MKELIVHALVIAVRPAREHDRMVRLFTKEFGVLEARVVGGRRILSKFAPHLDPGNSVTVRLVKKNAYTVVDAVTLDRFPSLRRNPKAFAEALTLLFLVARLVPKEIPDPRLWHFMARSFTGARVDLRATLKILGYDPLHAACDVCGRAHPPYFVPSTQTFVCAACRGKLKHVEVLYI